MTARIHDLPRHWPILFVLDQVGTLRNNFHLQKILYLAQVEHHVPIPYTFALKDYGPYSRTVKADFIDLSSVGLIELQYGDGWIFRITDQGRAAAQQICAVVDKSVLEEFRKCVEKWSRKGLYELKRYVYGKHLLTEETYMEEREDLSVLAETLMHQLDAYPTSSNKLLIQGALDYARTAIGKEKISDPAQRNHFLRAVARLIEQGSTICTATSTNPTVLRDLRLAQLRDDFNQFQEICEQYQILPSLYDENTDLLTLLR